MSDDAGRISLHVGVIRLHVRGKLQCQLILETIARSSYMHVSPTDASQVGSQHVAKGDGSHCDYDHIWHERENRCISGQKKEPMHFWHERTNAFLAQREPMHFWHKRENQCISLHEERTNAFCGHEITCNIGFLTLCWHAHTRTQSAHTTRVQTTILVDLIFHTMTIYKWWSSTVNSGDNVTAVINGGVTSLAHTQQEVIN